MRWHKTVMKWRTEDARWTFVDVFLWFVRLSFVPNGILDALFEDFESPLIHWGKVVTLFTRRTRFSHGKLRYSISASCCFSFKRNASSPMVQPVHQRAFEQLVVCRVTLFPWALREGESVISNKGQRRHHRKFLMCADVCPHIVFSENRGQWSLRKDVAVDIKRILRSSTMKCNGSEWSY